MASLSNADAEIIAHDDRTSTLSQPEQPHKVQTGNLPSEIELSRLGSQVAPHIPASVTASTKARSNWKVAAIMLALSVSCIVTRPTSHHLQGIAMLTLLCLYI